MQDTKSGFWDGPGPQPNRKTRRAIERAPEPRRTNVERQNRSDARPVNARKLKVRAARHARDIEARRAERYGNV